MFIYDQQGAVKLSREEGREEGLEEGRKQGREEGRKEGREEEKRAIARQLLARLEDKEIAKTTGLSIEAVRNLPEEN